MITFSKSTIPEVVAAQLLTLDKKLDYNMFTLFNKPEDSKELFFALSSSLQIVSTDYKSTSHKFAGLYAIYKDSTCYYVGQSQNLASRISQHLSGKYSSCDRVDIYFASEYGFDDFYDRSKEARKSILETNEMMLMKRLSPVENLITPKSDFNPDKKYLFGSLQEESDNCPNAFIHIAKHTMCVCMDIEPELIFEPLMKYHNKYILDVAESSGMDVARENFCNG